MADGNWGIKRLKKAWAALIGDEREAQRKDGPRANNSDWDGVVGALQNIRSDNQVSTTEQKAEWERAANREWRRFWIDVAAIFIAAIGAWILWGSLMDSRKATIEANRAWLVPVGASYQPAKGAGQPFTITFSITNPGREPALDEDVRYNIVPVVHQFFETGEFNTFMAKNNICDGVHPVTHQIVTYQVGVATHQVITIRPKEGNEGLTYREIAEGGWGFIALKCLAYRTFGKERHTAMCFKYLPGDAPDRLADCPGGNWAD